jgi:AraC-like DNA-binding protein
MSQLPEPTVGIASARALIDFFQTYKMSAKNLADALNVNENLLTEEEQRLPISLYEQMWQLAELKSGDPALGLTMADMDTFEDLGLVAHVVYNSATLAEGLTHYVRLFSVVNESIDLKFLQEGDDAILRFQYFDQSHYIIADMERTLGIVVKRTMYSIGPLAKFRVAMFKHSPPEYEDKYKATFPCPVKFDQPYCELRFDRHMLNLQPKRRNPHTGRATLNYANHILSRLFKRKVNAKVKRIIEDNISDNQFDAEKAAKLLNMSRQTMYRKLKNDGTSYSDLVDEVKQNKAFQLLLHTQTPLTVIAYDLGFSELSAFTRAFKRWTGKTPAEYRKDPIT